MPDEAIEEGRENFRRELASLSSVLVKAFTYAVSDAVSVSEEIAGSDKLWSLELEGLTNLVGVS